MQITNTAFGRQLAAISGGAPNVSFSDANAAYLANSVLEDALPEASANKPNAES
jgi:hypothetical protein